MFAPQYEIECDAQHEYDGNQQIDIWKRHQGFLSFSMPSCFAMASFLWLSINIKDILLL
jgi:hypothetical protein